MSERDYIDTVVEMNKKLAEIPNSELPFTMKITVPKNLTNCWRVSVTYASLYKTLHLKWYKRIYRCLFPIRSYVKWRVYQYFFRVNYFKSLQRIDKFLAWGDDMTVNTGKFDNMDIKKIGVGLFE